MVPFHMRLFVLKIADVYTHTHTVVHPHMHVLFRYTAEQNINILQDNKRMVVFTRPL